MVAALFDNLRWLLRPVAFGLLIIIGLSILSDGPSSSANAGRACSSLTNEPTVNRVLCRLDPSRIWNMKLSDLLSFGRAG